MIRMREKSRLASTLLLATLLLLAHVIVVVHAFEHDAGTAQSKVCAVCMTAAQLGAASVTDLAIEHFLLPAAVCVERTCCACRSRPIVAARQRGPPASS